MKRLVLISLFFAFSQVYAAQTEYHFFVQFHDKGLNYVNIDEPEKFLSPRALERRERLHIPIDSLDLPVTLAYIDNIRKPSIRVRYVSKWLNGAVISTPSMDSAYRLKIKFFVDRVVYLGKSTLKSNKSGRQETLDGDNDKQQYGDGFMQLDMLQGTSLHQQGYKGEDMLIAVFDAGFRKVDQLPIFSSMFEEKRMVYSYDLVDEEENVFNDDDHGLHVLGIMAADQKNKMIGSAPKASYVLLRTESNSYENWLEELNWVRAAEMADSMGVDVINSSLGYNTFDEDVLDHQHSELDGKSTYISRGASVAASRGMLVVNSAGNDGNKNWGKLDFPADVEDILVVGAVDAKLDVPAFSSPGPTVDFRIKPDVAALGRNTTVATTYGVGTGNGTSYSCPIVAGLMACLWQANPELTISELRQIAIHCSHMSLEPDNAVGHGLPNFNLALVISGKHAKFDYSKTTLVDFNKTELESKEVVTFYLPNDSMMGVEVKTPGRFLFFKYQKKHWKGVASVQANHFGKIAIPLYNIPSGKPVQLDFYTVEGNKKKTNFRLYKGSIH